MNVNDCNTCIRLLQILENFVEEKYEIMAESRRLQEVLKADRNKKLDRMSEE